MNSPEEPLISPDQRNGELQYDADDADTLDAASVASKTETKPGVFILLLTFAAGISGLLFGCKSNPQLCTMKFRANKGR